MAQNTLSPDERIARITFGTVYSLYLEKVTKKGRTREELNQVIEWLTGFNSEKIAELATQNISFESFFQQAELNRNAYLISGVVCGIRVEEIQNPLTQKIRYLDKLVDELAKGKKMEKVMRA